MNLLKKRLRRLREVVDERFPDKSRMLPSENNMKTRRILVERIEGTIHEMDCVHHLRNVWLGDVEKALTSHLNVFFKDSLANIDKNLRVSASMSALIRAFDREFSIFQKGTGKNSRSG